MVLLDGVKSSLSTTRAPSRNAFLWLITFTRRISMTSVFRTEVLNRERQLFTCLKLKAVKSVEHTEL